MDKGIEPLAIEVRDGSLSFREDIFELCAGRYGEGYLKDSDYSRWMQHPELFKVALAEGRFAGFAVMIPAERAEIMARMAMPEQDVLDIAGNRPALIYKSAAVLPEYEGRGVMRAMTAAGIQTAKELGYGAIFGSAWVCGDRIPIQPTFDSFGFLRLYERKMLWYGDEDYHCILCGGRCRCDGVIYYKKL